MPHLTGRFAAGLYMSENAIGKSDVPSPSEPLAQEFQARWESQASPPDVFLFLAAHPGLDPRERIGVLRVDQRFRWTRGEPLSLQRYLSEFPDIATKPDLVRLLVDGDRDGRRESKALAADLFEGLRGLQPDRAHTEVFRDARDENVTIADEPTTSSAEASTRSHQQSTKKRADGSTVEQHSPARSTGGGLGFDLDTAVELMAETETLRPVLVNLQFTPLRQLGAGGMGVVFEAYDEERGELVALKTVRRVDPAALVRFKQEFRTLCDLTHPNLVNLYQLFAVDDFWFFTMELVDGCDFLMYVRGESEATSDNDDERRIGLETPSREPSFREDLLRPALLQLAEGVYALHTAGKLHRDIKPPNVLVTRTGRVVLLDFGLTADLEPSGQHQTADGQIVGTLAHMSPEQALGLPVTVASDWYSVGVILYTALTGRLPFEGRFDAVVEQKKTAAPPCPSSFVDGLPEDLVQLCLELLSPRPSQRPSGARLLDRLRGHTSETAVLSDPKPPPLMVGRSRHRQVFDSAYAALRERQASTIFLLGRTGTGKTTLIRSFLEDLLGRPDCVVLFGRCYERECVPFKAVDSIIDALSRHLKGLPPRELESLLPRDFSLLARVFPVIRGIEAVNKSRRHTTEMPDPQELRLHVFAGLRELLSRLGQRTNLVIVIDDLQWGDVDSAVLLSDLLYTPDRPLLLFVGCFRLEDAEEGRFLRLLREAYEKSAAKPNQHELVVEALTQAESRELALALLGRDDAMLLAQAHLVARESAGNPLFIDELIKHIQAGSTVESWDNPGQVDLEMVLRTRILSQSVDAQRLLEVVSVSGRPIHESLAFRVGELGSRGRIALGSLRSAKLVRGMGPDQPDQIETYHNRIRKTVLAHLPAESLRWYHARLAHVLESSGQIDAEDVADHYRGADDHVRACELYIQAADIASRTLAFDHAARLYRLAQELGKGTGVALGQVGRKLGDALASSGRGAEAAAAYLQAANGVTAAETLELKRLASTQLLISGHVDEGMALLRTILGPLGLTMPSSPKMALFSLIRNRALLRLRGLRFRRRDQTQVSAEDLTRIDLCWSAVAGLSVIDPILGADFQSRGLLLALRAGEPFRIARSLAMEAAHLSTAGASAKNRVARMIDSAEALALSLDSPHARGMIHLVRGVSGLMLGQWKQAQSSLDQSETLFRNHCTGVTWERDTASSVALWALMHMGQLAELKRRWSLLLMQAQERGDLYAVTTLTTFFAGLLKLAGDAPRGIEEDLEAAMSRWTRKGFYLQHASTFRSLLQLDLYRGRVDSAWERVSAIWPQYTRSMLLRIQMIRIQMLELRARSALAAAESRKDAQSLLHSAAKDARRLEREGERWARAHAHYVHAGIAAYHEDAPKAIHHLGLAASIFDAADMLLHGCVMRYRMGEIEGGNEGRRWMAEAEVWIKSQSIESPAKWSRMYAPGFSKIATCHIETTY
jgi:serine/threonine protein kinase